MEIRPIIIVLADISGYTQFIKYHRVSLIHAEKIITELLESVIESARVPLILHEIEGDAVSFYAIDDQQESCAKEIFEQVERFIGAFRKREAELISECRVCECDACARIGQLRIKAVLHRGEAAFSKIQQFTKISGEDVILAHRLLKNTIPSKEYILMTDQFVQACPRIQDRSPERRTEHAEGLGEVTVHVIGLEHHGPVEAVQRTLLNKMRMFFRLEGYLLKRMLGGKAERPARVERT
jgi:hypothetical protein